MLRRHKVTLVSGEGRLDGPGRVRVQRADATSEVLAARDVLLATGARSRSLPGFEGIDAARLWGPREKLYERALKRLDEQRLEAALVRAADVDRLIKGLRAAARDSDPWLELTDLALQVAQ